MANMRNQNPRRKGLVDIFVILILLFIVSGIMMFVFNGGKQVDELTWDEFIQVIQTENVKEYSMSGVAGSGNQDATVIQGIYTDEYAKDMARKADKADVAELNTIISHKTEETVLHEEVVNTPVWTNQPTYDGTLEFDTSDYYYVTLKNTDGTALPSGQFKLMPMYDKYAEAYETVFTLTGLNPGNASVLSENVPVEFTADYKLRNAGVGMVTGTLNKNLNTGVKTVKTTKEAKNGKELYRKR